MENKYLEIFFWSMAPITELRLSVPLGVLEYKLDWIRVLLFCILGNFLICIPLINLLSYLDRLSVKSSFLNTLLNKIYSRTRSKTKIINNYKYLGVICFVGIPLPFTGAWTGCFASHLLGLNKKKTLLSILAGLIISSTIVILVIFFAQHLLSWIGYEANN